MKPTIKALMMVSILLLAVLCVFEAANAQPQFKTKAGLNAASHERAGPVLAANAFAIESFDQASCKTHADVVAETRQTRDFAETYSPLNATIDTREAYARRSFERAIGFHLRE